MLQYIKINNIKRSYTYDKKIFSKNDKCFSSLFLMGLAVFDINQIEWEEIEILNYAEELKFDVKDFSSFFIY